MLTVTFGLCQQWKQRVVSVRVFEICIFPPLLVVRVSRGAQSTVDGFYGTHTKNSPTALNVRRGTPGGRAFGHKGVLLLSPAPGDVPHEHTWRDINQQEALHYITATSVF